MKIAKWSIKKARTMQTEIKDNFPFSEKSYFEFSQIRIDEWNCIFRNFPVDQKFRCQFPEISMGEWYRLFQDGKRQAAQFCSRGIFQ